MIVAQSGLAKHRPEWHAKSDFEAFIVSPEYKSIAEASIPFIAGPTTPQLFETEASPANSARAPLTAVLRTRIKGQDGVQAAKDIWSDLVQKVQGEAEGISHGPSVNLEEEVYVGVLGWGSREVSSHCSAGVSAWTDSCMRATR